MGEEGEIKGSCGDMGAVGPAVDRRQLGSWTLPSEVVFSDFWDDGETVAWPPYQPTQARCSEHGPDHWVRIGAMGGRGRNETTPVWLHWPLFM